MSQKEIGSILDEAMTSEVGHAICTPSYATACSLRRKLYAFRDQKRKQGNTAYDQLSFIPKQNGELQIIKRPAISKETNIPYETRLLERGECPVRINAKGKHKPGLMGSFIEWF